MKATKLDPRETAGLANLSPAGGPLDRSRPSVCQLRYPVGLSGRPPLTDGAEYWLREDWATAVELDVLSPADVPFGVAIWWRADGLRTGSPAPDEARGEWRPAAALPFGLSRVRFRVTGSCRCRFFAACSPFDAAREGITGPLPFAMVEAWDKRRPGMPARENPEVFIVTVERAGGAF